MNTDILQKQFNNLKNFILKNGGEVNDNLAIRFISQDNREIYALDTITVNTQLFKIPEKCCINKNTFHDTFNQQIPQTYDSDVYGILTLLHHIFIEKEKSFYYPYLVMLPSDFSYHPLQQYTPEKRNLWQKISVRIMRYIDLHLKKIGECTDIIKKINDECKLFPENIVTDENIRYCYLILRTRQWGTTGLCPLADMLQHSSSSNMLLIHDTTNKLAIMNAKMDVARNDTIFDNYGIYDDMSMFVGYGFVEHINDDFMRIC